MFRESSLFDLFILCPLAIIIVWLFYLMSKWLYYNVCLMCLFSLLQYGYFLSRDFNVFAFFKGSFINYLCPLGMIYCTIYTRICLIWLCYNQEDASIVYCNRYFLCHTVIGIHASHIILCLRKFFIYCLSFGHYLSTH